MQQKMSILLCVMFTGIVITGCGGTTEKKTWRTIAESGFYQDGGQDFGIVFLFNDISTGEYHLAAKAADKLRNDIGAKEGSDAAIRSRLAFAQKQLDEGAECVALIFAWEKQGSSAPQNPSKPGGPPPKPPKKQVVKFGFPSEDVFQFDILTQQLTVNKERKTVRFPDCDGKCYVFTKDKTFTPVDLDVKDLFRFHCAQYDEETRANASRSQTGSGGSWSGDNYFYHQNFLYSDDVLHENWYEQLKSERNANRINMK